MELNEIKYGQTGYGFLVERDAGSISLDDVRNIQVKNELGKIGNSEGIEIVDRLKVFAVLQKHSQENANGRIYPESVLKKQCELYQLRIDERRAYGEMNHPESVTIDGSRISHIITKIWWEGRTLVGELELVLSPGFVKSGVISCEGDRFANYLRLGIKMGVSSRGLGSVEQDRFSKKFLVQDDFELTCFDVVTDPSTKNAWVGANMSDLKPYVENKITSKKSLSEGLDNFLNKKKILK